MFDRAQHDISKRFSAIVLLLLLVICSVNIISTYERFSPTTDEPPHIVTGMEWLDKKTYDYEYLHPPLARVMIALPLYLRGMRLLPEQNVERCKSFLEMVEEFKITLNLPPLKRKFAKCCFLGGADLSIMYREPTGAYSEAALNRNMFWSRLSVLPFYLLAVLSVFFLGTRLFEREVGLVAALFFASTPTLLGHAALATTDMPFLGLFTCAVVACLYWLQIRSWSVALLFGLVLGLSLLTKFSALLFLPVVFVVLLLSLLLTKQLTIQQFFNKQMCMQMFGIVTIALLVIWSMYRFSFGAMDDTFYGLKSWVDTIDTPWIRGLVIWLTHSEIMPFPEYVRGLLEVIYKNQRGHANYIFGERLLREGVWYFFPVALFFKSTLAFVIAFVMGVVSLLICRKYSWYPCLFLLGTVAAIMAMVIPSEINIGVRHVLHIYPFLAIIAAFPIVWILKNATKPLLIIIAVGLLFFQVVSFIWAYPDNLAYFNVVAGKNPESILVDSDLDWGQDAKRLANYVEEQAINKITICGAINNFYLDARIGSQHVIRHCPQIGEVEGWFAVNISRVVAGKKDDMEWVLALTPYARIGKSIWLYHFDQSNVVVSPPEKGESHD